jgi:pantothenate kinase
MTGTAPLLDELARRASGLAGEGRVILGIAGCPAAGKSTLAEKLAEALDPSGRWVVRVPMDGFHLANEELERLGRRGRKGAIDTFDAHGYLALLRRLRADLDHTVFAPDYRRALGKRIASTIAVEPGVRLVITEGNYLLCADEPWPEVRREMAEVWYVDLDDDLRRERLLARHEQYGKSPAEALRWLDQVDEVNARLIAAGRDAADLRIDMSRLEGVPPPFRR